MRRWLALAAALFVLLTPGACALFSLQATLLPAEPLVLDGVVAAGVDARNVHGALAWPAPTIANSNQPPETEILDAEHARFVLVRWAQPTLAPPSPLVTNSPTEQTFNVDDVSLRLSRLMDRPQMSFDANNLPTAATTLNATGPQCLISHAEATESVVFPDDPNQSFFAPDDVRPGPKQLAVDCEAKGFQSNGASRMQFYGVLLHLIGQSEDRMIQTGTFEEAYVDYEGFPVKQTVTQILVVKDAGSPIHFDVGDAHVRFFAAPLLAVGRLSYETAAGDLRWGPLRQDGPLGPFSATGEYTLDAAENNHVVVNGHTIEGPPMRGSSQAAGFSATKPILLGVAVVGGLALLALAARGLWSLFTRLEPESVLAHPRRERIFAYVREHPGVHMADVARTLDLRWTKVLYHVTKLSNSGHLRVHRVGGRTALFPTKMGYAGKEQQVATLMRPRMRQVLELWRTRPGMSQSEMARELGVHRAQVSRSMAALSKAGLLNTTAAPPV